MKELYNHWDEMRLVFRGGRLSKSEGWRNVVEHQTTQLLAAGVLADLLGLNLQEKNMLMKVALVHDWAKRLDKKPDEFSPQEKELSGLLYDKVNPDPNLMHATGPRFLDKVLFSAPSFLEFLQFYLDDITKGNQIVRFDERIDEVESRRQDLNSNEKLTEELGGRKYWDLEREVGHEIEKYIFDRLTEKNIYLASPQEIPDLINSKIEEIKNG